MSAPLTGVGPLLRASLTHDGRRFAPWVAIVTLLSASSVLLYPWLFPDTVDRMGFAAAVGSNPAISLIFGPAEDLLSTDGFNAWRSLSLGGFVTALGAILAVVRASRAQEDSGQAELLASSVISRSGRLIVGVLVAMIGSLAVGVVAGLVTWTCGGEPGPTALLCATFVATGWMFAALAGVAAQLGAETRTATSIAVGALGVAFIARGFLYAIDAPDWLVWLDPLAWMTETWPTVEDRWWPLLLGLGLTVVLLAVAFVLQARRDFGGGAIGPRPGPATGRIRSVAGLVLRAHRGAIITWLCVAAGLGIVFGYLATSVSDILAGDSAVQQVLAAGAATPDQLIGRFLVTILSLVGIILAIPGVQIMLAVRSEELADRAEPVLAAAVARPRYWGASALLALTLTAACTLIAGTEIALLASSADIGAELGDTLLQAVVTVPAVWAVVAVSMLVVGARPRVLPAAWVGVIASFGLTLLGPSFKLPDWALGISPFWHVPSIAGDEDGWGLLGVAAVALLLAVIGLVDFRRRDLATR